MSSRGRAIRCGLGATLALLLAACAGSKTPKVNTPPDRIAPPRPTETQRQAAAQANLQLGIGYLREGHLALAQTKLERANEEDPHNANIHAALGLLDERLGKDKDADKEYKAALALAPQDPAMLNNYAVFLCSHGRASEGVRDFEAAAANPLYSSPWAAYTNAGVCQRQSHHLEEAAELFARAIRSNPSYAEALFQAADLDFEQKNYASARLRLEFFLNNNPATPDLLLLGWRIARAQNDTASAARYAQRLAKEFPGSDQARAIGAATPNPG